MTTTIEQYPIRRRFTGEVICTAEISVTPDMMPSVKIGLAVRWAVENRKNLSWANLSWADLSGANLSGANLSGTYLSRANLSGADLSGTYLSGANLSRANLSRADLSGANLSGANLSGADLSGADLSGANLSGANLSGTYLSGADLSRADLSWANLSGAYLSRAENLTDTQLRPIIADLWFILSQARAEIPAMIAALKDGRVDGSTYSGECACLVGTLENAGASDLPHMSGSPAECWFLAIRKGDKPGDDSAGGFAAAKALAWIEEYCRVTGVEIGK